MFKTVFTYLGLFFLLVSVAACEQAEEGPPIDQGTGKDSVGL